MTKPSNLMLANSETQWYLDQLAHTIFAASNAHYGDYHPPSNNQLSANARYHAPDRAQLGPAIADQVAIDFTQPGRTYITPDPEPQDYPFLITTTSGTTTTSTPPPGGHTWASPVVHNPVSDGGQVLGLPIGTFPLYGGGGASRQVRELQSEIEFLKKQLELAIKDKPPELTSIPKEGERKILL